MVMDMTERVELVHNMATGTGLAAGGLLLRGGSLVTLRDSASIGSNIGDIGGGVGCIASAIRLYGNSRIIRNAGRNSAFGGGGVFESTAEIWLQDNASISDNVGGGHGEALPLK